MCFCRTVTPVTANRQFFCDVSEVVLRPNPGPLLTEGVKMRAQYHRNPRQSWPQWLNGAALLIATGLMILLGNAANAAIFTQPLNSSPIAISADQRFVWVVNPRDDTVSVLRTDNNTLLTTIATGKEPRSVALDPNNTFAFISNAADGTVTILH